MRLKDIFYLNHSDRRVLAFALFFVIVATVVICFVGGGGISMGDGNDSLQAYGKRDAFRRYGNGSNDYADKSFHGYYASEEGRRVARFPFDPNTADSTALLSLGLQPWQVRNIYKYRAAGGVYRRKEDFAKVYGLTNKQYRELEPYIRIAKDFQPYVVFNEPRPAHINIPDSIAAHRIEKLKAGETIELNSADTTMLMRVPGVGKYYARQIYNCRKWLGGFYTPEQLLEIEYFPTEAINYFRVDESMIKKLNINELSLSDLKRHPYINYYQAKDIVDYRRMRGPLKNIDELRLMKNFSERDIARLKHYVEY